MNFVPTALPGAYLIESAPLVDERGFFAYVYHAAEFERHGLDATIAQINISRSKQRGTLRGLHYQLPPYSETKVVRCVRGAAYDVIVDLRPTSPTFKRWVSVELTASNCLGVYLPTGFAHGFQTLTEDVEMLYLISQYYAASHYAGVRWNDPTFGIEWPAADERFLNERDRTYPDFQG
jgi:dTDP-4-dehydrorhamnose 3,5-epimerase